MLSVIGCGNLNRSDDGVGVVVAHRLMEHLNRHPSDRVQVFDAGTGGMDVMFRARGARRLVIIDASHNGAEPGAIFQVPGHVLAQDYQPALSLHDFRWDHALYAGRRIFGADFPTDITVFLVEAATLELGTELSAVVRNASERVVKDIVGIIEQHVAQASADVNASVPCARIASGSIYLDSSVCSEYFGNAASVAILKIEGRSLLFPLRGSGAGGLLLKVLNSRGDRVVHAEDFLRTLGIERNSPERHVPLRWCPDAAGLILEGLASPAN